MKRLRLFSLLLCAALALALLPAPSRAAAPTLSVGTVSAGRGDEAVVEISLSRVNGVAGGSFTAVYDPDALTLLGAEAGVGGGTVNTRYADNAVRLSFAGTAALKKAGTLLTLRFRVRGDAEPGLSAVTLERARLYDVNASPVEVTASSGGVKIPAVLLAVSSGRGIPGQSVKLDILLEEGLLPAGGRFDISYDPKVLSPGSVKAEPALGGVPVDLSWSADEGAAAIRVSWASASSAGAPGKLCTVIFSVTEDASGETAVRLEGLKCFGEDGGPVACLPSADGTVTVERDYSSQPMLYIVGGRLEQDGSATVEIAVDGAGEVCGGSFSLAYDTGKCRLTELTTVMDCAAVNPASPGEAAGTLKVSWAGDSPSLDNETVLRLRFEMLSEDPSPLELSAVVLKDRAGKGVEDAVTVCGKAGIKADLQAPVAELVDDNGSLELRAMLFDAAFCGGDATGSARVMAVASSGGRFAGAVLAPYAAEFDHNGIARVTLDVSSAADAGTLSLLLTDADGNMIPMCEKTELKIEG